MKYQGKHDKSVDMKDPSVIKPRKSQDTAAITPRYENLWGDNALVYKDPLVSTHVCFLVCGTLKVLSNAL